MFTAPTEIYTLSLHDALPICTRSCGHRAARRSLRQGQEAEGGGDLRHADRGAVGQPDPCRAAEGDRKSTRLNSSHVEISYAVFCLKKKTKHMKMPISTTGEF